jgi:hypothetical protein
MTAGIDYSRGKFIALLDGDLRMTQPTSLPLLELLKKEDWDVVAGNRRRTGKMVLFSAKYPAKLPMH